MDLLTENYANSVYNATTTNFFPTPGKEPTCSHGITTDNQKFINTALQPSTIVWIVHPTYFVYLNEKMRKKKEEKEIEDGEMVCEFPNVFLDNLLGLLVDMPLEFTIDLEPGSTPMSKAPYRMAPKNWRN